VTWSATRGGSGRRWARCRPSGEPAPGSVRVDSPHPASPAFRRAQKQVLLATSACYLVYYTGRQNFGWAIPGLRAELGLSATEIGWISAAGLVLYGAGQLVSGHVADRAGGRRLVAAGAVLSCLFNWLTSFGGGFWSLAVTWALNGYAQSMGFAPASRLIAAWWAPGERGRAFGIFNFAAGFSSVVTFATAALVLTWLSWRWVFRLPVMLLLAGAAVIWLLARDHPVELGLSPDGEDGRAFRLRHEEAAADGAASLGARLRSAFANRPFLLASLGFGFANWARLGLLVWVPSHLLGAPAAAGQGVAWIPLALPVGMAIGALVEGDAVDRFLGGNHPRLIVGSLLLAAVATLGLLAVPPDGRSVGLLFVAGFLVFGPFPSFTVLGAELLGPGAVGAGVGFMNAAGYGVAAVGDVVMGAVIDATGRTATIFAVAAGACVLGAAATWLAGAAARRPD
jgi:MFS transporter, OPA family, glycerol-3-phosphate transporter